MSELTRLWSFHVSECEEKWLAWPVVNVTAQRVIIPRDRFDAERIIREGGQPTDGVRSLKRAGLERDGYTHSQRYRGTGIGCDTFYTDGGRVKEEVARSTAA